MADSIETLGTTYETFPFLPDYSIGVDKAITPAYNIIEYPSTVPTLVDNVVRKPISIVNRLQFHSMGELNTLLSFFDDHRGRTKKFWYYCRTNDFILFEDIVNNDTEIDIHINGYSDIHQTYDRIYILTKSGDYIVRRATDAVDDVGSGNTTITITPAMDRAIAINDILYFGRVLMVRFDIDRLQIKHESNSVGVTNIRLLELPQEYPAT